MLIPKVKICGITNYEDATAAMEMGADLLGFNFYPESPRYVTPKKAANIISKLPAFIDVAGVFVNSPLDEIREIASQCQLDWVQLHGDENPEFCRWLAYDSTKTMKAIRVKDAGDIDNSTRTTRSRRSSWACTESMYAAESRPNRARKTTAR